MQMLQSQVELMRCFQESVFLMSVSSLGALGKPVLRHFHLLYSLHSLEMFFVSLSGRFRVEGVEAALVALPLQGV